MKWWRKFAHVLNILWYINGDFIGILSPIEKKGWNERYHWLFNGFRKAVMDSSCVEIHMEGICLLGSRVLERLEWWPWYELWHFLFSNHYPILLSNDPWPRHIRVQSRLKFENGLACRSWFQWHNYNKD